MTGVAGIIGQISVLWRQCVESWSRHLCAAQVEPVHVVPGRRSVEQWSVSGMLDWDITTGQQSHNSSRFSDFSPDQDLWQPFSLETSRLVSRQRVWEWYVEWCQGNIVGGDQLCDWVIKLSSAGQNRYQPALATSAPGRDTRVVEQWSVDTGHHWRPLQWHWSSLWETWLQHCSSDQPHARLWQDQLSSSSWQPIPQCHAVPCSLCILCSLPPGTWSQTVGPSLETAPITPPSSSCVSTTLK